MYFANIGIHHRWSKESFRKYKIPINNNTLWRCFVEIKAVVEAVKLFCQRTYTLEEENALLLKGYTVYDNIDDDDKSNDNSNNYSKSTK